MTTNEVIAFVEGLGGVLTLRPGPGDGSPEIAWGDAFLYYSPDGTVPANQQPFATVVTKDYPEDRTSGLDRPGAFRVNVAAGTDAFREWTGLAPREGEPQPAGTDDAVLAHPVYGALGWLCVVNPGPATDVPLRELLTTAHAAARTRHDRRTEGA